jgi:hypothetical protein
VFHYPWIENSSISNKPAERSRLRALYVILDALFFMHLVEKRAQIAVNQGREALSSTASSHESGELRKAVK